MRPCVVQLALVALAIAFTNQSSSITKPSSTKSRGSADLARAEGLPRLNRQSSIVNRQFLPSQRTLLDAHNAYPDRGRFADRIDVALATGLPVAIEQDLAWCVSAGGTLTPLVSHESTCVGGEPTLETYFFERVRPIVEAALAEGPSADWPLITLNLDFKTNEPEHHAAVWALLGKYEHWLTTAPRVANPAVVASLQVGPLLVLTGSHDLQQVTFHDAIPVGARLRVFGAIAGIAAPESNSSALPRATPATNYRRWWNHPWRVVEVESQRAAGEWTPADAARLAALVSDAHVHGLWIRFYTLNGVAGEREGWTASYNFGSLDAAARRWRAAIDAKVDFIATDQYADFARSRP
jgi:hypothetical protein